MTEWNQEVALALQAEPEKKQKPEFWHHVDKLYVPPPTSLAAAFSRRWSISFRRKSLNRPRFFRLRIWVRFGLQFSVPEASRSAGPRAGRRA